MLTSFKNEPMLIKCHVNGKVINFEIDSGSHISTINVNEIRDMHNISVLPTNVKAKAYGENVIRFEGEVILNVCYGKFSVNHKFLVVHENCVSLFGRDLCKKLGVKLYLPSDQLEGVHSITEGIFTRYKSYLSDEFKSCVKEKVTLKLNSDLKPIFCKARPVPFRFKELIKAELKRLVDSQILTKVYRSEWACPTVNVMKSDGKIRICGDYSMTLNKCMNTVQYPLPTIEDVLGNMGCAKIFSKVDLQQAYLQLPLDESSKQYTTINTCEGLFMYNYMPFGISSAPGIFQSFICQVLSGIKNVIIYQDDILVMTKSKEEHNSVLDSVLNRLFSAGVKLNLKKCDFFTQSVQYLGYTFTNKGVQPSSEKIRAILDAPPPSDVKQVQSFIGLCTFYSRFIKNFSDVFAPFYKMLRKGQKFQWNDEHDKCFNLIKDLFRSDKILRMYNPELQIALETDASSMGLGAVLLQKHADGWRPVQFASRTLNAAERNYSQIEREALSVIFGCERFKQYLLGSKFIIRNDHKPLTKILSGNSGIPNHCSARLKRWALRLSQFSYDFHYIKGSDNVNSDFLSRMPLNETEHPHEPYELIFVINSINEGPITCSDIKHYTNADSNLRILKNYIRFGFPPNIHPSLSQFKSNSEELTIMNECIMYRNRVFVPLPLRSKILEQFHLGHPGISGMRSLVRSLIWYPGIDSDVVQFVNKCGNCQNIQSKPPQNCNVEWPKPARKWSRLHIDHFFLEDRIFFIVIDALTKYIECEIVKNTGSCETINILRCIFSRNGLPDVIVSDNALGFTSSEFKEFLSNNNVSHITPPPYSPSSNGQAERAVKVVKDLLKKK